MPNGKRQLAYSCWSLTIRRVQGRYVIAGREPLWQRSRNC
jgi:hypothetical protein